MSDVRSEQRVLAGDVGGTKVNIGLFRRGKAHPVLVTEETYSSADASGLEVLIEQFVRAHPTEVSAACFGIAGPVIKGESKATNLPWIVSERKIAKRFGLAKVELVNDLAATAYSVPALRPKEMHVLNSGRRDKYGNIGLVAPGTGLGMALGTFVDGRLYPQPSEGGHVDFAPRNEREIELLRHMWSRHDHVSVERLVSGPGIFTIYSRLRDRRGSDEPEWLTRKLREADETRVVSEAAIAGECETCVAALDLFVSVLGAVAGNLALTGMTTGGIYLGGGIPPKILPKLVDGAFLSAFTAKGRFKELLSSFPVRVILNDKAALLGAARHGFELLESP